MKIIKAFIRDYVADKVIPALEKISIPRLIANDTKKFSDHMTNPEHFEISAVGTETGNNMIELEIVCREQDKDKVVETILANARTGYEGDGIIVISPHETIIRIDTGEVTGGF